MNIKYIKPILCLVAFGIVLTLGYIYKKNPDIDNQVVDIVKSVAPTPLVIKDKNLSEAYFTGQVVDISGGTNLAQNARKYVENTIHDFKTSADIEVPALRAQFGPDIASADYSLDIDAKEVRGVNTDSVVMSIYAYTGGANGNSYFKVYTVSKKSQKILTLEDVIKHEKKDAFVMLVKKELLAWKVEGTDDTASPLFTDDIDQLKFTSFENWAFDGDNFVLYFDKYAIAPGVMGSFEFPIKQDKIKDFLAI